MDLSGLINSGASLAFVAVVGTLLVGSLVVWIIRRSAARMARRNQEWIDQLPISTGSRTVPNSTVNSTPEDTQEALR